MEILLFIKGNWQAISNALLTIFTGLFALSEVLGGSKKIKSNNVYQLIYNFLILFKK